MYGRGLDEAVCKLLGRGLITSLYFSVHNLGKSAVELPNKPRYTKTAVRKTGHEWRSCYSIVKYVTDLASQDLQPKTDFLGAVVAFSKTPKLMFREQEA